MELIIPAGWSIARVNESLLRFYASKPVVGDPALRKQPFGWKLDGAQRIVVIPDDQYAGEVKTLIERGEASLDPAPKTRRAELAAAIAARYEQLPTAGPANAALLLGNLVELAAFAFPELRDAIDG